MERILKSKYKILDKIADCQSHATYSGALVDTGVPLIIKIYKREFLNSSLVKKIKKDVSEIAKIYSRSIPRVYDGDYGWQGFYFIRERVDGRTVAEIAKPVDPEDVCSAASSICECLEFAHSKGMAHGSLTPNNIFICGDGVRVSDFGIRSSVSGAVEQRAFLLFGDSKLYLAPEVILGEDPSARSDIYQLGLVMYQMLTGELPEQEGTGLDYALNRISKRDPSLAGLNNKIPRFLGEIIARCLEKDPLLRFESAAQLAESLKNKSVAVKKADAIETSEIPYQPADEKAPEKVPEPDMPSPYYPDAIDEKSDKINMLRLFFFTIWAAIAAGIVYSLINIFFLGD